jgi:hypothetical protein
MTSSPHSLSLALICALILAFPVLAQPDPEADPDEPKAAGQPVNFSRIVGPYELSVSAAPTELSMEDPLVLTVRLTGSGPPAWMPDRARLRLFPHELEKNFFVKPLPAKDRYLEKEKTWEFSWELRPRHLGVRRIPALELVYYDNKFHKYQTVWGPVIPLTVKPRAQARPPDELAPPFQASPDVLELATGPRVLRRQGPGWPGLPALIALVLSPPALCGLWYAVWRRRHPGEGTLVRRRQSQAAELALQALSKQDGDNAGCVAGLLAAYLRQRLDLAYAEPTPREAARHLRRLGASPTLARQTADILGACDAARFAPGPAPLSKTLAVQATQLILALEAEPWTSYPC